ncbi:alanine--tRNA ligase [Bogoriella caseilytica]|uniref:Alanine--tRNA ligase n=1 Tax=Bogoriella caseilytica TaxID=56055 RepID=A0A3N2B8Z2_9MICO|nr:alanine--tRNA ligase [Bogoriella caseilytica]ROR71711.1 alanyl-tRNA synthetase [Bogoriella caseilytica]
MRTAEIRSRYLDFFAKRGHEVVPSASLISPDPSILFTIAGMVPFIPYIVGTEPAPWPRAVSVQKCIRTNDIENVGRTTRHGTFFQMGGNFSFGDYFKQGAIDLSWELLTTSQDDGGFGVDPERLWITLWEKDEESYRHLTEVVGLSTDRIVLLPWEESCWDTGQPGPAGSTGEWHYDRGPEFGPEAVSGQVDQWPGSAQAEDRYIEIWNLVFDQFLRGPGSGKDYELVGELEQTAIDTGLGVERLAYLLQGEDNMYEIDETFPVIAAAEQMSGRTYAKGEGSTAEDDVRFRVVADHVRSALMLIGDGVRPGNEGRGYVLRRLIRRAVRAMRLLGVDEPSLPVLLPASKDAMKASYLELDADFARISQIAYAEEESFRRTLAAGTTMLETAVAAAKETSPQRPLVSGETAFALHDTSGFPIDLTLEMAAEHGVQVDEAGFRALMDEQRQRARADAMAKKTGHVDAALYTDLQQRLDAPVQFLGYTDHAAHSHLKGLLVDGQPAAAATAPADVELVLDVTPFYAEAGGQLADQGTISFAGGGVVDVADVQAPIKGLTVHRGRLTEGSITLDEQAVASIDSARRKAIARAHTATHMVHKALHEHIGDQATQAGSENAPNRMRFDFRHGSSVPATVLGEIEERVNDQLAEDLEVTDEIMDIDSARAAGAMALFGEKYGNRVRVVSIGGDWSKELCAGTHVPGTGTLGRVTLLGESSIGSGVRRVDALVGPGAYSYQAKEHALVGQLSTLIGARPEELPERIDGLMGRLKAAEKELAKLRQAQLLAQAAGIAAEAKATPGTVRVATHDAGEVSAADELRTLALDIRSRLGDDAPSVVAIGGVSKGRPVVVIATNAGAREAGLRAGALVRTAAQTLGGGGGGKDDVAQGGGTNPSALPEALSAVRENALGADTP